MKLNYLLSGLFNRINGSSAILGFVWSSLLLLKILGAFLNFDTSLEQLRALMPRNEDMENNYTSTQHHIQAQVNFSSGLVFNLIVQLILVLHQVSYKFWLLFLMRNFVFDGHLFLNMHWFLQQNLTSLTKNSNEDSYNAQVDIPSARVASTGSLSQPQSSVPKRRNYANERVSKMA